MTELTQSMIVAKSHAGVRILDQKEESWNGLNTDTVSVLLHLYAPIHSPIIYIQLYMIA